MHSIPQLRIAGNLLSLEVLKYAGFLLMILDHANRYLWHQNFPSMDQAGRAVFPLFAMVLGVGLRGASFEKVVRLSMVLALLALPAGLAEMPLVQAGVRGEGVNVLLTLGCGGLLVATVTADFGRPWWVVGVVSMALGISCLGEYGPVGAALVWAAWAGRSWAVWSLLALLSVSQLTVVPLAVPAMFWAAHWLCGEERWRSPRRLFGWGYVAQFAVFSLILSAF